MKWQSQSQRKRKHEAVCKKTHVPTGPICLTFDKTNVRQTKQPFFSITSIYMIKWLRSTISSQSCAYFLCFFLLFSDSRQPKDSKLKRKIKKKVITTFFFKVQIKINIIVCLSWRIIIIKLKKIIINAYGIQILTFIASIIDELLIFRLQKKNCNWNRKLVYQKWYPWNVSLVLSEQFHSLYRGSPAVFNIFWWPDFSFIFYI